ncbi:MAG: hypothetical protein EOP48_22700 [Sphingobacteriales bacterium]|nr:MAG: hypothetical protein EOP48_22700 [Sphingobacteriales bacterium]
MPEKVLKIINLEVKTTRRGYEYKLVVFEETIANETGRDIGLGKTSERTFWPERAGITVLDRETKEIKIENWKGDIEYNNLKIGDLFDGKIIDFQTTPYRKGGQIQTSFSSAIFLGDRDQLKTTAQQLKYLGYKASLLDQSGKPFTYVAAKTELDDEFDL